MKKLLLILFIAFSLKVSASGQYTIINSSFNDSVPVALGSQQYIDVIWKRKDYVGDDSLRVLVFNYATQGTSKPIYKTVYRMKCEISSSGGDTIPGVYFLALPLNADSVSRRVYFTMPDTFPGGKFSVWTGSNNYSYGLFPSTTGINTPFFQSKEVKQINYYNLNGQIITNPMGFYIKQTIYKDGIIRNEKIYRME